MLFVLMHFFCICCKNDNEQKMLATYTIKINPDDSKFIGFKDWCSGIELIPLETTEKSLMRRCDKIIKNGEQLYIYDGSMNVLFAFDQSGKFIFSTKHLFGSGPDDLSSLTDFNINLLNSTIELLDPLRLKIRIYDLNLNYINEIKLPSSLYPIHRFMSLKNNIYLFYARQGFDENKNGDIKFYSVNKEQIIDRTGKHNCPSWFGTYISNLTLYNLDNDFFFSHEFPNNTIYRVNTEVFELEPHFYIDFGEKNLIYGELFKESPNDKDVTTYRNFLASNDNKNKYVLVVNKLENQRYFAVFFDYKKKYNLVLYDKINHTTLLGHNQKEAKNFASAYIMTDEALYSIPYFLRQISSFIDENLLDEKSKQVLENLQEDDNPVIIKYVLKQQEV